VWLHKVIYSNGVNTEALSLKWDEWIKKSAKWIYSVDPGGCGWSLPHQQLLNDLIDDPEIID